ncbi:MAG: cell division protein FtsQ/DivIB [Kocuria sp.]|nr:cell division protein FtsQ/DivIB [Kocuria sp.]MDN5616690.1 cell division protein FtsQ/DivIB [Kocuria sp.]
MSPARRPRLPRSNQGKKDTETKPAAGTSASSESGEPATVRVNDPSKVRVVPVEDSGQAESPDTAETTPGALTRHEASGEEGGRETRADRSSHPDPEEGTAGEKSDQDNIVAFPGRRADRGRRVGRSSADSSSSDGDAQGRPWRSRRRKVLLSLGVFVVAAVLFFGIVFFSPLLATQKVTIEGANLTDKASLQKSLDSLKGKPLTRVTTKDVENKVGDDIAVQNVSIEAHPPHELVVTIHERAPVAVVKSGDQYILVDKDGVAIGSKKSVEEAGVPLLDGGPDAVKSDAFDSAVQALQTLPRSLLNQLNKVDAESSNNIQLDMKDGSKVKWGTGEDSDYKAEVLNSLVQGLKDSGGASVYDVSSPDRPVTK